MSERLIRPNSEYLFENETMVVLSYFFIFIHIGSKINIGKKKQKTTFILSTTFRFIEASLYGSEVSLLFSILLIKKMRLREVNNFAKVHIVSKSHK